MLYVGLDVLYRQIHVLAGRAVDHVTFDSSIHELVNKLVRAAQHDYCNQYATTTTTVIVRGLDGLTLHLPKIDETACRL